MTDQDFDQALVSAAFSLAAISGWDGVSPAAAARAAGLPLARARERFCDSRAILLRFGSLADEHALNDAMDSGPVRERLFDMLMRRFDALQAQRAGVLALLATLPGDPATALVLAAATSRSMGWLLEAVGVPTHTLRGAAAAHGLVAVWLAGLHAWRTDESPDLSSTMAALDKALARAERVAGWAGFNADSEAGGGPKPFPEPSAATFDAAPEPPIDPAI
jgi:hypothetical protein